MTDDAQRTLNFLTNWIDANITHPSEVVQIDAEAAQRQFLTDAVAAGLTLDQVNHEWPVVVARIVQAAKSAPGVE